MPGISLFREPGRAVALAVVAVALVLRVVDPPFVTEARLHGFDLMQRLWPRPPASAGVAIVAIDEASLARYGQWPWPRSQLASLVRRVADGKPRVLGIDIIFSERDRLSPPEIARELPHLPAAAAEALRQIPPSEQDLAEAIGQVPTVLAVVPGHEAPSGSEAPMRLAPILQAGGEVAPFVPQFSSLLRPLPELSAAARGAGSIAIQVAERILRRVPMVVVAHGSVFPSFSLEVLRVAAGRRPIVTNSGAFGVENIKVSDILVPTDRRGRAILHFAAGKARYISAAELLDPSFDLDRLHDRIVLLGVTALGAVDRKDTPLGLQQGLDVHAQLIESMVLGELLHRPWILDPIEMAAVLLAGLLTVWLLRYREPAQATLLAIAIVAVLLGIEIVLFRYGALLFDGVYPSLTVLAAFGVMLLGTLRAAEIELRREREVKQRLEGELAAASAIQMGLLPQQYSFANRPDLDLFARIEPARVVGGDFYDFLLIDGDRRLFFMIADVSDKGIPAALFMATTKEIVRDAVLRFAPSLGRILAEVNRRTTEASTELPAQGGEMMFVTAFAGILDLDTGEVSYASAGHDLPFVVGGNPGVRRLQTQSGPPLGAIDPFAFTIARDNIAPGEVLLLYTDGITEAQNTGHKLYSVERLQQVLASTPGSDAEQLIGAVVADVRRFVGSADQADDITLLAVRRAPVGSFGTPAPATAGGG